MHRSRRRKKCIDVEAIGMQFFNEVDPWSDSGLTLGPTSSLTLGPTSSLTLGLTPGPTPGPTPGLTLGPTSSLTLGPTSRLTPGLTLYPRAGRWHLIGT